MEVWTVISEVAESNLFTKAATVPYDSRQAVPDTYSVPEPGTRLLLGQLVLEEALETIHALGLDMQMRAGKPYLVVDMTHEPDIYDIIDGACDTIYVSTGVLCAVGAPDTPHLREVCAANDRKFPDGIATINPETGKYLKPPGWVGPKHAIVRSIHSRSQNANLNAIGKSLLSKHARK